MNKKIIFVLVFFILIVAIISGIFLYVKIQFSVIYIRSDGNVDPSTAFIQQVGNIYSFTANINGNLTIQKDNIVVDGAGYKLQGNGRGTGIELLSHNVTVRNVQITSFLVAIHVAGSNNSIDGNIITDNDAGVSLLYSADNNTISNNIIENNTASTPLLEFPTDYAGACIFMDQVMNNVISANILANSRYGILTFEVSYNQIIGNKIVNNSCGFASMWNAKHIVYLNSFLNNTYQIGYNSPSISTWDNGTYGNYWSDYNGIDTNNDGLGDTPYIIDANNQDRYPLIEPLRN